MSQTFRDLLIYYSYKLAPIISIQNNGILPHLDLLISIPYHETSRYPLRTFVYVKTLRWPWSKITARWCDGGIEIFSQLMQV